MSKKKNKLILLNCAGCGIEFEKEPNEYRRQLKKHKNHNFYCSLSCKGPNKWGIKNRHEDFPFNIYLRYAEKNSKRIGRTEKKLGIDTAYLKKIWEKQNGICPYTGLKMIKISDGSGLRENRRFDVASLDRIDSNKGYIKGNVEFVCKFINWAKNSYSKEEVKEFLERICEFSISKKKV